MIQRCPESVTVEAGLCGLGEGHGIDTRGVSLKRSQSPEKILDTNS